MSPQWQWALCFVAGGLIGVWLIAALWQRWQRHKRRQISRRAQRGESGAEKLLRKRGYIVLEAQVRRPVTMMIDGALYESFIKADYLVERAGRRYLVEVKTGKQADPHLPNVRRQLFEYQNIFHTDGILFIDMNKYDMMEVSFKDAPSQKPQARLFFWGVCVGIFLTVFILSYQ